MASNEPVKGRQHGRDLFDDETLRRVRLTPEGEGGAVDRHAGAPAKDAPPSQGWLPWVEITDAESAIAAAHQGACAAALCAIVTLIVLALSAFDVGPLLEGEDAAIAMVAAAVLILIAWGIYNMSRVAAVLGLVLYVGDRLLAIAQSGRPRGLLMLVFVVCLLINGVRGTFAYRWFTDAEFPQESEWEGRWGSGRKL